MQTMVGKAGDFALEQLPDIAMQYVMYGRAMSLVYLIVGLVVAGAFLKYAHWAWKNPWNHCTYDRKQVRDEGNIEAIFITTIVGAVIAMGTLLSFDVLVWFAPKVWLIKEMAVLLK